MDVVELKNYIIDNSLVDTILESIGCHHIVHHDGYWTCGNVDGDNRQAIVIYDNENLTCINYTRQLSKTKRTTDIFDLISYNQNCTFPESLKFVCEQLGIDYYNEITERPESLILLQLIYDMASGGADEDTSPLKPIPEKILEYYLPYLSKLFEDDGISLIVQKEFGICYDPYSDRICIPIRDSVGTLVGVKGRLNKKVVGDCDAPKYLYMEKCNKSKLLYGYYENKQYIKNSRVVYIFESEKAVLQMASHGIRNCVATGGKTISKTQVELISRTECTPIFCYDSDVELEELQTIAEYFIDGIDVYAMVDDCGVLGDKESPSDNYEKFVELQEYIQKIN